jgi:hypothetical protein
MPVRREDLVVAPIFRNDLARLHHGDPGKRASLDAMLLARPSQTPLPLSSIGAHVLAQEHGVGTHLQGESHRLLYDVASSNHERGPSLAELSAQLSQGGEEERHPVGRSEGAEHLRIEDEEWCNGMRRLRRTSEGRMVVKA